MAADGGVFKGADMAACRATAKNLGIPVLVIVILPTVPIPIKIRVFSTKVSKLVMQVMKLTRYILLRVQIQVKHGRNVLQLVEL